MRSKDLRGKEGRRERERYLEKERSIETIKRTRKSHNPKAQDHRIKKKEEKKIKKFHEEALGTQHKRKKKKKVGDSVISV